MKQNSTSHFTPVGTGEDTERAASFARLKFVLLSAAAILVIVPIMSLLGFTQWPLAFVIALGNSAVLLAWAMKRNDAMMKRIWVFSLAFGVAELVVDAWLVDVTGTLDYKPYSLRGGPMLWASPAFMPFSWQVLVVHVTCIADALRKQSFLTQAILTTLAGGIYVPLGEEISCRAGFWVYTNVPRISEVPYYIILGEAALASSVVLLIPFLRTRGQGTAIIAGVIAAVALFIGYGAGVMLFGVDPLPFVQP